MKRLNPIQILAAFATFAVILILMPRTGKFKYDYAKGQTWNHETLYAPFDFPIYKTDSQIWQEKSNLQTETVPYYRYSEETSNKSLKSAEGLEADNYTRAIVSSLRSIYEKGVVSDDLPQEGLIYVQRDKRAQKYPATEVYRLSDANAKLLADVSRLFLKENVDSIFRARGIYDLVVPNLLLDRQATDMVNADNASASVSPTSGFVKTGQLVVSYGEIITADVEQILDSFRREYEANLGYSGPKWMTFFGNALLAVVLILLLLAVIFYTVPEAFLDSRYYYILLLFLLASSIELIVGRIDDELLYLVPTMLFAVYMLSFFTAPVIICVYVISLLPMLVFSSNGMTNFVTFFAGGMAAIFFFKNYHKGWQQFMSAFVTFLALALVHNAFRALGVVGGNIFRTNAYLFIAAMLNVAGYPFVYLFERAFNLVSNNRLAELCDTSSPILRELENRAPGTFQHSLQVMNMADAVARRIGLRPTLVRAGALYHDIGKINNPLCFIENESLLQMDESEKFHSGLTPAQSASFIIRHVHDGVDMARRNNLPKPVIDIIRSHHGTSLVSFFYNKYVQQGGDPVDTSEFQYDGAVPKTKDQVIIMLCDSVEAGARTLKDYSPESCSAFVESIVNGKIEQNQLCDSDISLRELNLVKEELKLYIAQSHHGRISYSRKIK